MEFPKLSMISILFLKIVLFYLTEASQNSSLSYDAGDSLLSIKRYKRSGR